MKKTELSYDASEYRFAVWRKLQYVTRDVVFLDIITVCPFFLTVSALQFPHLSYKRENCNDDN